MSTKKSNDNRRLRVQDKNSIFITNGRQAVANRIQSKSQFKKILKTKKPRKRTKIETN